MPSSSPLVGLLGMGFTPTLDDLIEELSLPVLSEALGAPVKSHKAARQAAAALGKDRQEELFQTAMRLLSGSRIDKEDLEQLAKDHGLSYSKATHADVFIHQLVKKVGLTKADELIERALKPGQIELSGTYSSFAAPSADLATLNPSTFGTHLEMYLQAQLTKDAKEERKVKVRVAHFKDQLLVVVYFERPNKDGREITAKKQLRLASFRRGAGSTYFRLSPTKKGTLLTLRTPTSKLAAHIRSALGAALWGNAGAIPESAAHSYDLDVFKAPDFVMQSVAVPGFDMPSVRLQLIEVLAATGNLLKVTAISKDQDALVDFRKLSKEAKAFTKEVTVRKAELRISYTRDGGRVRVARALLKPDAVHMNEEHFLLVEEHLRAWGVINGASG